MIQPSTLWIPGAKCSKSYNGYMSMDKNYKRQNCANILISTEVTIRLCFNIITRASI